MQMKFIAAAAGIASAAGAQSQKLLVQRCT